MNLGVEKCVEVIDGFAELLSDGIGIIKGGGSIVSWPKYLEVAKDLIEIARDIPGALPELRDLEPEEFGVLAAASFAAGKKVLASLKF